MAGAKPVKIVITDRHMEFFRNSRIYFAAEKQWLPGWLSPGVAVVIDDSVLAEPYSCFRSKGNFFSIGSFSYSRSTFPLDTRIGRYCAIADNVTVMGMNHPMDRLSMSGFDYSDRAFFTDACADAGKPFRRVSANERYGAAPVIEHDVWIGMGATIARGITVGTGSIIATRSVVTRDVPPYAMVAGNPAKVKKFRFPEPLIARLLASEWWRYAFFDFNGLPTTRPERFLDAFEPLVAAGSILPYRPRPIPLLSELQALS